MPNQILINGVRYLFNNNNDIDFCFRLHAKGYKIICTLDAKLYHYESASRGLDVKEVYKFLAPLKFLKFKKLERYRQFLREQNFMRKKWSEKIKNDPFYNEDYI